MKINYKLLFLCIVLPLIIGGISGFLTQNSAETFAILNKPPLSPPGWVFPVVWTLLYMLMGVASYLILSSGRDKQEINTALTIYGLQLFFNFFWSIIFFSFNQYLIAFIWLIVLWILIILTILKFEKVSSTAAYLLVPYIIWVSFAGYLNLAIYLLN